jgi:alkyl hydroperoxide reductase subunit F
MHDLIIVGGGPAGLTATIYALRKRLDVLLITRDLGGKTNYRLQLPTVEKHLVITGEEVVNRFVNEIEYLDFAREFGNAERIEKTNGAFTVTTSGGATHEAKAVIVATGAKGRLMGVPGEREYMMRGLCYSAVSYAPLFIEKQACVIGDTKLALRSAAELSNIAEKVTLIAPSRGELDSALGRRVTAAENVEVLQDFAVEEVLGDEYARKLVVKKDGERRELEADAFFVELELEPRSKLVAGLADLDDYERIKIDASNHTSIEGLFAAGDVTDVIAEQVLIAVGEGAKAALAAYEYLLSSA